MTSRRRMKRLAQLFPDLLPSQRLQLQYDEEGLYSTTEQRNATTMTEILGDTVWLHAHQPFSQVEVVDATAGIGGNTLSFARYCHKVHAFELNFERWRMLRANVQMLQMGPKVSCYHGNFVTYLKVGYFRNQTVFFIDPPWGGLKYHKERALSLSMSGVPLHRIVNLLPHTRETTVGLKVPLNFALDAFKKNLAPHVRIRGISHLRRMMLLVLCASPHHARQTLRRV